MPTVPRVTIDDAALEGQACSICGELALHIAHVDKLPDYVSCGSCGAVFVVEEGGDRVMYGKIPAGYPETSAVALRQWLMPEVVERHAIAERPRRATPAEGEAGRGFEPAPAQYEAPEELGQPPRPGITAGEPAPARSAGAKAGDEGEPAARFQALLRSYEQAPQATPEADMPLEAPATGSSWESLAEEFEIPEPDVAAPPVPARAGIEPPGIAPPPAPLRREAPSPPPSGQLPLGPGVEPPAGARYNVRIRGYRVRIPKNSCAHCLRIPAGRPLAVLAPAPPGSQRRIVRLNLPLCPACYHRAHARSREESGAKLQAHLISALVALFLVVSALGVRIVNLEESPGIGLLVLLILAVVGYGAPAFFLLGRTGRFPTPEDTLYVRSTLMVRPETEPAGLTFSWRNQGTADLFFEANNKAAEGQVVKVADKIDEGET